MVRYYTSGYSDQGDFDSRAFGAILDVNEANVFLGADALEQLMGDDLESFLDPTDENYLTGIGTIVVVDLPDCGDMVYYDADNVSNEV